MAGRRHLRRSRFRFRLNGTVRSKRRRVLGLSVVLCLLPSCGRVAPVGGSKPSVAPTVGRCPARALSVHGGRQAGGFHGYAEGTVVLTNQTSVPCSLAGNPTVSLLDAQGIALPLTETPATNPPSPPVSVAPDHTATLIVYWSNWCGASPGSLQVKVELAGGGAVTGPFNGPPNYDLVPACIDDSQPSTIFVVHAYLSP